MSRNWIVVGDTTVSGGKVLAGSPTIFIDDFPLARQGDPVLCGQHGSTRIASGDPTTLDEGRPWARQGDYCDCGCQLMSAKQFRAFSDGGGSQRAKTTASSPSSSPAAANTGAPSNISTNLSNGRQAKGVFRYEERNQPYHMRQAAYLSAEGVGAMGGAYQFKGHVVLQGTRLFISASGFTAASHLGEVTYYMTAKVSRGGEIVEQKVLQHQDGPQLWPDDTFSPIGTAVFLLPEPTASEPLILELEGGYYYSAPEGLATPAPPTTSERYDLRVVEE